MKLGIGADHAGFQFKVNFIHYFNEKGIELKNFGTDSEQSVDYPDYIHPLCAEIENGNLDFGIIVCGSGNGVAITANKHTNIRAALCWNEELASLARKHNNANIIAIPARFIDFELAKLIIDTFFNTEFEGGRHQNRVDKISKF
jgi:ribose 5-phosphate isomerase B